MASITYTPRRFGSHELPVVGRRIRLSPAHCEDGETFGVYSETASMTVAVPAGTLCDVVAVEEGTVTVTVDVYVKDAEGEPVTHRVIDLAAHHFLSIKGRPFVVGVDDRRHDLNADDAGTAPVAVPVAPRVTPAPTPKVTAVPKSPAPSEAEEALGRIAGALGVKLGGGLGEDEVRELIAESVDPLAIAVGEVQGEAAALGARVTDAERKLTDALEALATASPAVRAKVRIAVTGAKPTGNPITDALGRFYAIGEDRNVAVMLASPPSLGKSYAVREFGRMYDLYLEHGCSDEMDEIATVLGSPVPDGAGGFVIPDGVLTQAVRTAGSGKSVLLLLDEILRLPSKVQEWFLMFLTGRKRPDGSRYFELRTRRVDDGALEVITCDAANLHIVAATNLGMIAPLEAFWSRWEVVRFAFDPATVRHVCDAVLAAYGVTGPTVGKLAGAWTAIVTESRKEVANGTLRVPADIRMLERAVSLETSGNVAAIGRLLASRLTDNLANWSADLGDTDAESAKVCAKLATPLLSL